MGTGRKDKSRQPGDRYDEELFKEDVIKHWDLTRRLYSFIKENQVNT